MLAIQEIDAVANPDQQQNSSFQIVRRIDGQASKRRKTERVALPEVYTFGAIEVYCNPTSAFTCPR